MKQQKDLIIFAGWTENMRDLINWGGIGFVIAQVSGSRPAGVKCAAGFSKCVSVLREGCLRCVVELWSAQQTPA